MAELAADNKLVVIPAFETETKDWAHLAANGEKEVISLQAEQLIHCCAMALHAMQVSMSLSSTRICFVLHTQRKMQQGKKPGQNLHLS